MNLIGNTTNRGRLIVEASLPTGRRVSEGEPLGVHGKRRSRRCDSVDLSRPLSDPDSIDLFMCGPLAEVTDDDVCNAISR